MVGNKKIRYPPYINLNGWATKTRYPPYIKDMLSIPSHTPPHGFPTKFDTVFSTPGVLSFLTHFLQDSYRHPP
ncbi:hypothetical protein BGS_0372 [Beggiatoa sp. SS]|nr:hypothetical protein BGS_0372 [Beggiatoa sp. SS]